MSETRGFKLSWLFVALIGVSAATLLLSDSPALASDDHDRVRLLRESGEVLPLAQILGHPSLAGLRVLEAELEREHGRLVYELELLDADGRVRERYYDALSGQPLGRDRDR